MSKVIDVRKSGGDVVILGKALVLPVSATDGTDLPLEASVRFNPDSGTVEVYTQGSWTPLGAGEEGAAVHSHTMAQVTGLSAALATKADTIHTHPFNEVDGLTAALAGKSALGHTHSKAEIVNLDSTLNEHTTKIAALETTRALTGHVHTIDNVNGLHLALEGKANISHFQSISTVNGLTAALERNEKMSLDFCISGLVPANHTHLFAITQKLLVGENFLGSAVKALANPSVEVSVNVLVNTTQVGTITVGATGIPTMTTVNPVGIFLNPGDTMRFEFGAQDPSWSTVAISVLAKRIP